jgi:cell division protein FtsB
MKNNYELKQTMLLSIENETLRERVKELKLEIKKLQDEKREGKVVQGKGENAIIQE